MLEANIKQLIQKIIDTENAHLINDDEKAITSTDWEFAFLDFDGWIILYLATDSIGGYWMYPMLYPESKVSKLKKQLPSFDVSPTSVAYSHVMNGKDQHWIEPYWEKGSEFEKSEVPLLFKRQHYGYGKGKEGYFEFNQLVTHPLELHWSGKKNSYCSVNNLGEEVEKIKIIADDGIKLILIRRKTLDKLLLLGQWVLVRYFIFDRWISQKPSFETKTSEIYEPTSYEVVFPRFRGQVS